jgi:hypothetical protein
VPKDLQSRFGRREIFRSLSTDCKREAHYLAAFLNLVSERLFALAREDETLSPEDLAAAARHWLATPMYSDQGIFLPELRIWDAQLEP